jgi:hypothetical protein
LVSSSKFIVGSDGIVDTVLFLCKNSGKVFGLDFDVEFVINPFSSSSSSSSSSSL